MTPTVSTLHTSDLLWVEANVIGYCLGGTLLACTLAYMTAKKDKRVKSATYFTAMMDFKEAGELGVFIDEVQLAALEEKMQDKGYLEDRKSVVEGKSESVRVDLGGRRSIKKKKKQSKKQ